MGDIKEPAVEPYRDAAHFWQEKWKEQDNLLGEIKKDYDHPWPNEDIETRIHRESVLVKITSIRLDKNPPF